jgi:fructose-bisphosphate aldolase class II
LEATVHAVARLYPELVFGLHLDHGDEQTCYDCIDSGHYSSVMVDASRWPLDENIAVTRRVVEHAHPRGVAVEAEVGRLGGKEEDIAVDESEAFLTDPDRAAEFVARSGCDSLAVAVGTSHGIYKLQGGQQLRLDRLAQIQQRLPGFPLVLHGASSVPAVEIGRINAAGGRLGPSAQGVPEDQYRQAVQRGIAKINVDTDSRLVWTRVHREYLRDYPANLDPREPGRLFVIECARLIARRSQNFGCAGRLPEVRAALAPESA